MPETDIKTEEKVDSLTEKKDTPKELVALTSGDEVKVQIDPLAVSKKFKRDGDFVVEANYDPTLSPVYKSLNDKYIQLMQTAETERTATETKLGELTVKLKENSSMAEGEKKTISDQIINLSTELEIAKKEASVTKVDLLKVQTAISNGLPFDFIKYVTGSTSEEIAASVKAVLNDFKLQSNKVSQEVLDEAVRVAAATAAAETAEALKTRGSNTEGAGAGEHTYTRAEIASMSLGQYKANRAEIDRQRLEGLIK